MFQNVQNAFNQTLKCTLLQNCAEQISNTLYRNESSFQQFQAPYELRHKKAKTDLQCWFLTSKTWISRWIVVSVPDEWRNGASAPTFPSRWTLEAWTASPGKTRKHTFMWDDWTKTQTRPETYCLLTQSNSSKNTKKYQTNGKKKNTRTFVLALATFSKPFCFLTV